LTAIATTHNLSTSHHLAARFARKDNTSASGSKSGKCLLSERRIANGDGFECLPEVGGYYLGYALRVES
jgi:hypothetical protein